MSRVESSREGQYLQGCCPFSHCPSEKIPLASETLKHENSNTTYQSRRSRSRSRSTSSGSQTSRKVVEQVSISCAGSETQEMACGLVERGSIREGAAPSRRLLHPKKIPPASEMLGYGIYPHYPAHDHHNQLNPPRDCRGITLFPAVGNPRPSGDGHHSARRDRRSAALQDRLRQGGRIASYGGGTLLLGLRTRRECRVRS